MSEELTPSERRNALSLLDLRVGEWLDRYLDHFPTLCDKLHEIQTRIDHERNLLDHPHL